MSTMRLMVLQPSGLALDTAVTRVVAEGPNGAFCLLPRHIDTAAALVPGILTYVPEAGGEAFMALNGGVLVKRGAEVSIATRMVVTGELGKLRERVEKFLEGLDDRERRTRAALARLEADMVRRFMEFGRHA